MVYQALSVLKQLFGRRSVGLDILTCLASAGGPGDRVTEVKVMQGLGVRLLITITLSMIAVALPLSGAAAESLKEQLTGAWTLTSADAVRPDGSRVATFGSTPKGIIIFSADGRFALIQMRSELPRIAANSRDQGTPEEYKAIVSGSIAYFGTYAVSEGDRTLTLRLEGSTFPNVMDVGEQKRIITLLNGEELKFTNPRTPAGTTLEVGWKRAK